MTDERLERILSCAAELFIRVGFRKTSVADIARESGLSIGAIYDYFENKTCIFYGLLYQIALPYILGVRKGFPLKLEDFSRLEDECIAAMDEYIQAFGAPLRRRDTAYGYKQLLGECFDRFAPFGQGTLVLKANPGICPRIFLGLKKLRIELFKLIEGYIKFFVEQGVLRPIEDTNMAARFLLESLYYWSSIGHWEDFTPGSPSLPQEKVRETCIEALYNTYALRTPS